MRGKILIFICLSGFFFSCNTELEVMPDNLSGSPLVLNAGIETKTDYGFIKDSFEDGDKMGVFITAKGNPDQMYENNPNYFNCIYEYKNGVWESSVPVMLKDEPADIYAYYPHIEFINDIRTVYVLTDHCHLGMCHDQSAPKEVNASHPVLNLKMVRKGCRISMYLKKSSGHNENITIERVSVKNKSGEQFVQRQGIINLINGNLSRYSGGLGDGYVNVTYNLKNTFPDDDEAFHFYFFPTVKTTMYDGDIYFQFLIGIKSVNVLLPAGTNWKPGVNYRYHIVAENESSFTLEKVN